MAKGKKNGPLGSIGATIVGFLLARWLGWLFFIPLVVFFVSYFLISSVAKDKIREGFVLYVTFVLTHLIAGTAFLSIGALLGEAVWNLEMLGNLIELLIMAGLAGAIFWKPRIWLVGLSFLIKAVLFMIMLDLVIPLIGSGSPETMGYIFNIVMRAGALLALVYGGHRLYMGRKNESGFRGDEAIGAPDSGAGLSDSGDSIAPVHVRGAKKLGDGAEDRFAQSSASDSARTTSDGPGAPENA